MTKINENVKIAVTSAVAAAAIVGGVWAGTSISGKSSVTGLTAAEVQMVARQAVVDELKANPKLIVDTISGYMNEERARQARSADQQVISKKVDIALADKFPFIGNPNGGISLVYFFDANCVFCKKIDPVLKRVVAENPDVKIIHREIPILAPSSRLAAHVANMVWDISPDRYGPFHDKLMAHKGALTPDNIEQYLKDVMGKAEAEALLARVDDENDEIVNETNNRVQENMAIATAAGITGTPFVYVIKGDGLVRGAGDDAYNQISTFIAKARQIKD